MPGRLTPAVGETFDGYAIEAVLGRGGMGTVFLATHERLARKVALKVIAPELAQDEEFRGRFLRESQLAASLDHPNVIPIYDADEVDGVLYIAMRYVTGPSLRALIKKRRRLGRAETLRIAAQIGGALDAAHRAGLVHRDVKPANILLGEHDEHAYLCDFGLAKRTSSQAVTQAGSFLGTVDYSAPEQIRGEPLDGRADVYSLGCVLFHCLAGQAPFARDSEIAVLQAHLNDSPPALSGVRAGLQPSLDDVLAKAMAKAADDRFPTAGALAAAVAQAMGMDADATRVAPKIPVAETGVTARPRRIRRRSRSLIAAAILVVALAAAGAAVVATYGGSSTANDAKLRTFVDRIENVLRQSAEGRNEIAGALADGFSCSVSPREAGQRIAGVADNRQSILQQLGTLQTPTQQADDVVTLLQHALQQSIEADFHYRDGFFTVTVPESGCPLPPNPSFTLARASDARATAAKKRFVAAFDPLARRFHGQVWSAGEF